MLNPGSHQTYHTPWVQFHPKDLLVLVHDAPGTAEGVITTAAPRAAPAPAPSTAA